MDRASARIRRLREQLRSADSENAALTRQYAKAFDHPVPAQSKVVSAERAVELVPDDAWVAVSHGRAQVGGGRSGGPGRRRSQGGGVVPPGGSRVVGAMRSG